jgi:hypothetical protein
LIGAAPSWLVRRTLSGNRQALGGVNRRLIAVTGMTGFGALQPMADDPAYG